MTVLFGVSVLYLLIALSAVVAGGVVSLCRRSRTERRRAKLTDYEKQIFGYVFEQGFMPHFGPHTDRELLCRVLETLCAFTYGYDNTRVNSLVEHFALDAFLRRKARTEDVYGKALRLRTLSLLGASDKIDATLSEFDRSGNMYVRNYALTAHISHSPETAIARIASHPYRLTPVNISEIITQLRRGGIPIAYEPMLESGNDNLMLLGLGVVRHYKITEALPVLYRLAVKAEGDILEAVLTTIALLHGTFSRAAVSEAVGRLPHGVRKKLYRFITLEGYSLPALGAVCSVERNSSLEGYLDEIVGSYKRKISL